MPSVELLHATTAAEVEGWLAALGDAAFIAVDTETAGWDPWRDRLRLVQLAAGPDRPVLVVDADHVDLAVLAPLLGGADHLKVFHHGAFDLRFLARAGLRVARVADTMLAQQLLDGGRSPAGLGLADLASYRLGEELDKSVRDAGFAGELTDVQLRYAADDAAATWRVFDQQWRELRGHGLVEVARLEFAALPVLADLQLRGVAFDPAAWRRLLTRLEARLPALERAAQAAFVTEDSPRTLFGPAEINLESPEQLLTALARVGVQVDSTREVVLADHRDHPAVAALLDYRQVARAVHSWGGDWADQVRHPVTGRIHAEWRQIVGSGRIACSDPNLTQIPADPAYRRCFAVPEGRALVVADYSQQELRILAAVSGDERMAEVFRRGGDLHAHTAALMLGVPPDAVGPELRKAAKALNFGLMYGMGAPGLARATGKSVAEAREVMDRYFAAFPGVARWLARAEAVARRTSTTRTPLGRLQRLEQPAVTLARNAPIQGAGADMTKLALAEVDRRLRRLLGDPGPGAADGLVLVVHDELVAEVPVELAAEAAAAVEEGMVAAAAAILGDLPAAVTVAVRRSWGADQPGSAGSGSASSSAPTSSADNGSLNR